MQVHSVFKNQSHFQPLKVQSEQSKIENPKDTFERSENTDEIDSRLALGLLATGVAAPVALGAAAGAIGVGAAALGCAALTYGAPDDSEYGIDYNSEALKSALLGGSLAVVGAFGGVGAVIATLGVIAGAGMVTGLVSSGSNN